MTTILLAAGLSSRMGTNKLLLPFEDTTIIETTLKKIIPFSDRIIVVVGHEKDSLVNILSKYNIDIIENIDYQNGQKSSTLAGIEQVKEDNFAILPGDLPLLSSSDIEGVFGLLENYSIARAYYKEIPGHPVVYRKENREKLLAFPGSMKEYLNTSSLGIYQGSLGAIFDIDTPESYKALLGY